MFQLKKKRAQAVMSKKDLSVQSIFQIFQAMFEMTSRHNIERYEDSRMIRRMLLRNSTTMLGSTCWRWLDKLTTSCNTRDVCVADNIFEREMDRFIVIHDKYVIGFHSAIGHR